MTNPSQDQHADLWDRYQAAYDEYDSVRREFFQLDTATRVALLKAGIERDWIESAIELLRLMPTEEVKAFLEELLIYVTYPKRFVTEARDLIMSLPRDWLIENIERCAEPALQGGDYVEYQSLWGIYTSLDKNLVYRLGQRALAHHDHDIQEVGQEIMNKLNNEAAT